LVDLVYVKRNLEEIRKDQEALIRKLNEVEKLEDLQDIKEFARVVQQKLFDLRADVEKGKKEEKLEEKKIETEKIPEIDMTVIIELKEKIITTKKEKEIL
jgi:cob(I)alamin adenosyltransferase